MGIRTRKPSHNDAQHDKDMHALAVLQRNVDQNVKSLVQMIDDQPKWSEKQDWMVPFITPELCARGAFRMRAEAH